MDKILSVVYVEDYLSDVAILKKILDANPRFKFLAHISTGKDAIRICPEIQPDFIIADCNVVDMDLVDLVKELMKLCPTSSIITSSMTDSHHYIEAMRLAGVNYFLSKPVTQETIHNTLTIIAKQRQKGLFNN